MCPLLGAPSIVTASLMAGGGERSVSVQVLSAVQPPSDAGMLKVIVSPPFWSAFASVMASRREQSASQTPSLVSAVLLTTKVVAIAVAVAVAVLVGVNVGVL